MSPNDRNLSIATKRARKKVIQEIGIQMLRGEKDIFNQSSLIYPCLTRHMMNGCIRRMKFKVNKEIAVNVTINNIVVIQLILTVMVVVQKALLQYQYWMKHEKNRKLK